MIKYDIGILGSGISGSFAAFRSAEKYKKKKVILFELGRPPLKRRRQLEGFLGSLFTSDGKLYTNDINQILDISDARKVNAANKWVASKLKKVSPMKVIKDKLPNNNIQKIIQDHKFTVELNNFVQWKPENMHNLSRYITDKLENSKNLMFSFDNEVFDISKQKNGFIITTENGEFFCKKIIMSMGRSGWRWVNKFYHNLGLIVKDNIASYGIRLELPASNLKDFNKSHCSLYRNDLEIGPFSWNGTCLPEDHSDVVLSNFRSNEQRWKSSHVSFSLIGHREVSENEGVYQTDRLAKLAFLLFNDRVGKEKVRSLIKKQSELSQLIEYDWLIGAIEEISEIIPSINKASFYSPDVLPLAAPIRLDSNLESEVENMFVCGESAGFLGIMAAMISGVMAMDSAAKS